MTAALATAATRSDPPISRLISGLVLGLAGLVALVLPLGYFGMGYSALASALDTKAQVKAEIINQVINASPEMWKFEEVRLYELLVRFPMALDHEQARILGLDGAPVVATPQRAAAPAMVREAPLLDAGSPVGRVQVSRSLRGLLAGTALSALAGGFLAAALAAALRLLQRRERRLADAHFDEQERARVTLQSIGDAVITTDRHQRIDYLNPVAEQLTQTPLAQARGQAVDQLCRLVHEASLLPIASPVAQVLHDGQAQPVYGGDVALLRPDGSCLAIEVSASTLHDRQGRVTGAALVFRDVAATRRLAQRVGWAATHDALTGLVNRQEFEARVDAALIQAQNSGRQHVLCYLDLDQFKVVNDSCGHAAGDSLLKLVATLLQSCLREADTLARLGGDEFGVLLEGCSTDQAQRIAGNLLAAMQDFRFAWQGKVFTLGASIGLAAVDRLAGSRADIFSAADTACYAAKEQGRNRACVFQRDDADMLRRRSEMDWTSRLVSAMADGRLTLYYQPYRALSPRASGEAVLHVEILLRLIDETGTLVPPGSFLPAAERYNLMPQIDRWVIQTVFARHQDLARQWGTALCCAINLSGTTLNADGLLAFVQAQADQHRLPPGAICFEVTETAAVNNLGQAVAFMKAVKALGFRFALDDFGIGSSSFAYLKTLPVDYLKIDGSFVRNLVNDPIDRAMVETIHRVGQIMGLRTVGEFAESPELIDALRSIGVDFAQGYGVQRPQPLPPPGPGEPAPPVSLAATAPTRRLPAPAAA